MKQQCIRAARRIGVLPLLERCRFVKEAVVAFPANWAIRRQYPQLAFPPLWLFYDAHSHCRYDKYIVGGKIMAKYLADVIKEQFGSNRRLEILDWGCGPARIIRWLKTESNEWVLSGCDYNKETIKWCKAHIAECEFKENQLTPPLPYPNESKDVVYCWSVFTHLSQEQVESWMADIARVIRPTGIFLFSTQSEEMAHKLLDNEKHLFQTAGVVTRGGVLEGSRMYSSFHSREYVRRKCGKYFSTVVDLGVVGNSKWDQCMWMAKR